MFSSTESGSPSYISSHSADVILSDIRPIKLKPDALGSINVLLDEFLFNILKSSRSLTPNKLRAGLLSVLPTTLGKEALLEAEVELRAYWDRTRRPKGSSKDGEDDSDSFNLQWAFELLRFKCEAYSTLNESDEDPVAEARLHERMASVSSGQSPPKPTLVAPAALYLTAILEAMCEHILSNVGRVAARDSSRTTATLQDVFVALCEDDSIYGLFKTMNIYEQIEQQAQEPKPRRSKSISRSDKLSMSRTSSQDALHPKDSSPTPRLSSEGPTGPAGNTTRNSLDKARSMKKFMGNGRSSGDRETGSVNGHKKSGSSVSENTKQTWSTYQQFEDDGSLKDFDDLMRSDATMKVSLTPDRLRTMEIYKQEKQEKDQRVSRKRSGEAPSISSRPETRRPSAPHVVDSILEDEEENQSKSSVSRFIRTRHPSITSTPTKSSVLSRTRSTSASGSAPAIGRKSSKTSIKSPPPSTMQTQARSRMAVGGGGRSQGFGDVDPFPPRTRKIQHNRESLDLDAVMAGSDGEDDEEDDGAVTLSKAMSTPKRPSPAYSNGTTDNSVKSPKMQPAKVSASTKELMDFLNEGPPPISRSGQDLKDFLDSGPPSDFGLPPVPDSVKAKGSGRLQRMMSKLNIGGEKERGKNSQVDDSLRRSPASPMAPGRGLAKKTSAPNLGSLNNRPPLLANNPKPPRPPQPQMISPPSSPTLSPVDAAPTPSRTPPSTMAQSQRSPISRKVPTYDLDALESSTAALVKPTPAPPPQENIQVNGHPYSSPQLNGHTPSSRPSRPPRHNENGTEQAQINDAKSLPASPSQSPQSTPVQKKSPPKALPLAQPSTRRIAKAEAIQVHTAPTAPTPTTTAQTAFSLEDLQELRRHISRASNSDECRLLMDIFFQKAGIPTECAVPYPSPSTTDPVVVVETETRFTRPSTASNTLELSLVELFLGGEAIHEPPPSPRRKKYSSKKAPQPTIVHKMTGSPVPVVTEGITMKKAYEG